MLAVNAVANLSFNVTGSPDVIELATAIAKLTLDRGRTMAMGTGSNQVNTWYSEIVGVTGGSNKTIDLQGGGAEVDAFGVSLDFDKIKMIYFKNLSDAAMIIGPEAQGLLMTGDPTTHTILLPVGAEQLFIYGGDGIVCDADSKDLFISAAGSGAKNVEVVVIGVKSA